jgi:hypothetical protein
MIKICIFCKKEHNRKGEYCSKNCSTKLWHQEHKEYAINYNKIWTADNKDYISKRDKQYYLKNKEQRKKQSNQYKQKNKHIIHEKIKRKLQTDLNFKLAWKLRIRLNKAINNNQKSGSAIRDLGCTIQELKSYLESKFQLGMSWDNWSLHGWHIDHIEPLCSFDLSDREQFLKACHYSNLQPMWAEDNLSKNGKILLNNSQPEGEFYSVIK